MTLTTRCPSCGTAFRVQPTQLSARGGKVRCGRCASVFDGVAALVAEAAAAPGAANAPETEPSPQLALFESTRKLPPLAAAGDAANEDAPVADFLDEEPRAGRRIVWALAALLALAVLAAQAVLHFRDEVAVLLPESRARLAAACAALGCELRLPRRPKLMAIESSDLQADGRRDSVIVLNAVVRNQAQFAQEYPALELTLTDERDEALARRVLMPADYLAGASAERLAQGIGPGADVALRMHFDASGVRAVGYRMYLFFP
ncbi:MAG: DUF3426 domain-containing protein [Betaproteobacteria bacterium]|nr:DUF3426 domain-containing protein [Betaproteobacteria bacterium]